MSKPIEIKGKRNIDKLFNIDKPDIRKDSIQNKVDDSWLEHHIQRQLINKLYLGIEMDDIYVIVKELNKKINGYKAQDEKKMMYVKEKFITFDKLVQKLVESKLTCLYCRHPCYLIYDKVRQMNQWTLDRIDNNCGHNNNNVVISCLKCNLERRNTNKDKFLFTKQLKIKKI
tara:strand:- start:7880 stop:8395 length:516 start_codon:yes stop_codon:yes gene_type:complete